MKITRSQLMKILREAIQLSDENKEKAIVALKQRLEDEGGAMSSEDAKETAETASGVKMDDDDFAALAQDADVKTHKSGDVVDTTGLAEGGTMKITCNQLSQIIKEEIGRLDEIDTSLTHEDAEYAYDTLAVRLRDDDDKVLNRAGTVKKLMTDPAGFEDMKQQIMQAMTHGHLKQNRAWATTKTYWKEKLGLNEVRLPVLEPLYAAGFKVVSSIPDAWSSLKSGESFSFEVPDGVAEALKTFLGGASWTPGNALTLKENKRSLNENAPIIIAGIGAGLLIIVLVAMVKGYSTDVEVGGKVAGQSAKAKIVLKSPSDSGQVNIGTQQGGVEPDLSDTLSEAIMVSLKPITRHPDTDKASTQKSRWAKLSGIPEEHINLQELTDVDLDDNGTLGPDELRGIARDLDDHSETSAEEAGMVAHHRENEDEIMNDRALALAQKIAHMFPQAGLGSVSKEELPMLARHLLAVKAELDPLKPWNKK